MQKIIENIKIATRRFHDQIEIKMGIEKLKTNQFSGKDLNRLLMIHYIIFMHLKDKMIESIKDDQELQQKVIFFLNNQLEDYSHDLDSQISENGEIFNKMIDTKNRQESYGIGYLYVYLGSYLGNVTIAKKLLEANIISNNTIPHLLKNKEGLSLWKAFINYLQNSNYSEKDLIIAISNAYEVYNMVTDRLDSIKN